MLSALVLIALGVIGHCLLAFPVTISSKDTKISVSNGTARSIDITAHLNAESI